MKILFDLSATQPENDITNHGGSEYAKAVFLRMVELYGSSISVVYNGNLPIEDRIAESINKYSLPYLKNVEAGSIMNFVEEQGINIFYSALPKETYLPILERQSETFHVVFTIHGLRQLELPTDRYEIIYCRNAKCLVKLIYKRLFMGLYKRNLKDHYRRLFMADRIVTVSEHSRKSIYHFFPELPDDKVCVFYSPLISYKDAFPAKAGIPAGLDLLPGKYFLVLSGSIWSKNACRAVSAFDKLITENKDYSSIKMVLTGMRNMTFKVKNRSNFIFTNYLERGDLESLLKNALALVYPSLNEGFGYPPLEALKYGVPVIASEIGPVVEVCGSEALFFDPKRIDDIKAKLLSAISEINLFSEKSIAKRYSQYQAINKKQGVDLDKMIQYMLNTWINDENTDNTRCTATVH